MRGSIRGPLLDDGRRARHLQDVATVDLQAQRESRAIVPAETQEAYRRQQRCAGALERRQYGVKRKDVRVRSLADELPRLQRPASEESKAAVRRCDEAEGLERPEGGSGEHRSSAARGVACEEAVRDQRRLHLNVRR